VTVPNSYEMTARARKAIRLIAVLDGANGGPMLPKQLLALSDDDWAKACVCIGVRSASHETRAMVVEMARERLAAARMVWS
jgi:hypothetical protein